MKRSLRLLGVSLAILGGKAANPPVKVSLRSAWSAPPVLAEVLETVALENPNAFFPFLDRLTDADAPPLPQTMSAEAIHQAALQIAVTNGFLKEPGSLAMVEMNLALHAATPKIEAFYHHYGDHHNNSRGTACGSWVEWYGEVVCDIETLVHLAGTETIDSSKKISPPPFTRPKLLTFDHVYPTPHGALKPPRTAILYGSLSSPNFRELHSYLLSLAKKPVPQVEYVFRHIPPENRDPKVRNYLSGYGVALHLKKTDYLAVDDRNTQTRVPKTDGTMDKEELDVERDPIITLIHTHPENSTAPSAKTPLTEPELEEIGSKAAQLIADSPHPLSTLTHLSQDFPKYATSLARRVVVNSSIEAELHANSLKVQGGIHLFWLNGAAISDKDINPLGLLRLFKKERSLLQSMTSLDISRSQAVDLLTHPTIGASQSGKDVLDGLFDASDRPEGGNIITWWNDMEKDSRYAEWSPSLFTLLRPAHPGQFPSVKLNLFNVVLVLDLSQTTSLSFIAGPVANIINRGFPLRFGVVPISETNEGARMARLFYHLVHKYGRKKTLGFITKISQADTPAPFQTPTVQWDVVRSEFAAFAETEVSSERVAVDLDSILDGTHIYIPPLEKAQVYAERLGATLDASPTSHAFINGKHFDVDDNLLRNVQMEFGRQIQHLQEQVYDGKLSDEHNETMSTYFYDQPTTNLRRNRYLYPTTTPGSLRIVNVLDLFSRTGLHVSPSTYIYPPEVEKIPLSLYIIADLDSDAGLKLVKEALDAVDAESRTRISFIHNPTTDTTETTERPLTSWLISHLLSTNTLSKVSSTLLQRALGVESRSVNVDDTQAPLSQEETMRSLTGDLKVSDFSARAYTNYVQTSRLIARELHLSPGEQVILVNGRVVGPLGNGDFLSADFKALEQYEIQKRAGPVMTALETVVPSASEYDRASYSHLVSMVSSIISAIQLPDPSEFSLLDSPQRPRARPYRGLDSEYTSFAFGDNSALYQIAILMDPLSETAQRWSSLLEWLSNIPDTYIEVHLNPARYKEIPLKRFYRYNILPSLSFDENGLEVAAQAVFEDLPIEPIYTLAMDVHSSWVVRPREALYDLDNIQLGNLSPGDQSVDAIFDLDYLVVDGHAREVNTNGAPRGVQLQLVSGDSTPIDDTQVVANLGYLQFKVKPGVFRLEIREGRGREIFKMDTVGNEGWDSPPVEEVGSEITLTSFEGLTLYPQLSRHEGKETDDVLDESKGESGFGGIFGDIASRVTSLFKPKNTAVARTEEQADINIFTVASGLLYERFVSIMILSVLRNTKSTVKFWFIENFLSPSFLEFIPHLAEAYGFKYELVTYKWPSWLREQTEKQRIIWAYKILFLDVLFPMDLKKVIFVDADQIVRADLKELVDLDLEGAPYGYTPMGDDNTEMEGFRFWKTGYWKDFLQGRPYHISALYVIDLVRFRQLAAGDILRGQYQQLSADPNSLANLDQDLPNNLQRQVPIFSLPEDWLWCETWCSKDRLHRAKTIDLCQNPLTKEPKLARARQIPEWEEYDAEIARFARKLAEEGLIHSGMAAADANVLANAGAAADAGPSTSEGPEETRDTSEEEQPRDEL